MFRTLLLWLRNLTCRHPRRVLEGIVREPMTWARQGCYHCPDCDREWISWQLPEEAAR